MRDMFGITVNVGDSVAIFKEQEESMYTGISETHYCIGKIIQVLYEFPTGLIEVEVEHYQYTEIVRNDAQLKKDNRGVDFDKKIKKRYYTRSLFNYSTLRNSIPEYFL